MNNIKNNFTKDNFRKSCLEKLLRSKKQRVVKDSIIIKTILEIIDKEKPKSVLLFIPLSIEPNILKVINILRQKKSIKVYVPYITRDSFEAVLYRLPLKKRKFGIKEPNYSKPTKKIDLAVVPIIGYDSAFRRVGFGKGMYDRFFSRLLKKPITVFIQRQNCYSKKKITNSYDILADYILS